MRVVLLEEVTKFFPIALCVCSVTIVAQLRNGPGGEILGGVGGCVWGGGGVEVLLTGQDLKTMFITIGRLPQER